VEIDSPDQKTTILYLPHRGYRNSCAYAVEGIKLKDIPIVCEYPDVFPDDFPGIPPDRDIEFIIELQPGTAPISKRPYRMPPNELTELKSNSRTSLIRVTFVQVLHHGVVQPIREEERQ
jgi:hypothetical protein